MYRAKDWKTLHTFTNGNALTHSAFTARKQIVSKRIYMEVFFFYEYNQIFCNGTLKVTARCTFRLVTQWYTCAFCWEFHMLHTWCKWIWYDIFKMGEIIKVCDAEHLDTVQDYRTDRRQEEVWMSYVGWRNKRLCWHRLKSRLMPSSGRTDVHAVFQFLSPSSED